MMRLELSQFVESDLDDIAAFIAQDNPQRAVTFIQEIRSKVSVQPPHLDAPDVPWQSKRFNKATGVVGDGVYKG
jgi:hypothetical protein